MFIIVVVKCKECGKKYQLDQEDNSNNFQCYCGGSLKSAKGNKLRILSIIVLVVLSYIMGYMGMWVLDSINLL